MSEVEVLIPLVAVISIFIVLPGMVMHYITRGRRVARSRHSWMVFQNEEVRA